MIQINLFQIPCFLKKSFLGKELLRESENYIVGSPDWIKSMSKTVSIKYFVSSYEINSMEEFLNLIDVCNYWGLNYCASIFVYYLENDFENENICREKLALKYFDLFNVTKDDMRNLFLKLKEFNIPELFQKEKINVAKTS